MRKWAMILGILVVVLAGAMALAVANLDSYLNENRDWVAEQAQSVLGRPLSFGEVDITLLGGVGVRVSDLRIGDDPAFSKEDFVSADAIDVRIAILPALFGTVEVTRIVLRAPSITVIQTDRGLSTDSLGGDAPETETAEAATEDGGIPPFLIASVEISDGTLRYVDETAKPTSEQAIQQLAFKASNVSPTGPIGFALQAAVLGATRPNVRVEGTLLDLENPKADFTVTSDALELGPAEAGTAPDVIRDLEMVGTLSLPEAGPRIEATLQSGSGTVAAAPYQNLAVVFKLQNQIAAIEKFALSAFGGELGITGRYDMRQSTRPKFAVRSTLSAMRVEQIVESGSGSSQAMSGQLGGDLDLSGAGSGWDEIKRSLAGQGSVQLVDGVLKDVNLAETALQGATGVPGLSGLLPPELREKYPQVFSVGDTVFENMDAKIDIRDGWVHFRDFALAARDYAFGGSGKYSLDNQLDMTTVMTASQALSEDLVEAAQPMQYLRGADGRVEFPVKLVGAAPDIRAVPDVAYIAKAASRQALGKVLGDVLGGSEEEPAGEGTTQDQLKKGLGGLLGR